MRVIDGAKARALAIAMTLVASIQLWPAASADNEPRSTTSSSAGAKAPKKSKKKKTARAVSYHHSLGARQRPPAARLFGSDADKQETDPIDVVLATARKQLGKPYRWGAVGPSSFDCSGFTMFVWGKGGVHLPHNSGAQNAATKDVALDDMRPGDLIFSPGHVGMYIGKGKMIHSPHSGRNVEIAPVHSNAYVAGRPKAS
jgi:peptidoglycan DL-endopeptidase CwlO